MQKEFEPTGHIAVTVNAEKWLILVFIALSHLYLVLDFSSRYITSYINLTKMISPSGLL